MNSILKVSLILLISGFLILGCKNQKDVESVTADAPTKWLNYEGEPTLKKNKKIVLVSGDEEYRSEEALPQLAKILAQRHGFDCTVLFAQHPDEVGKIDPNYTQNIEGLENLRDADLMVLFTRFRDLPSEQMVHFKNYLTAGKPLIGIRTATHAFHVKDSLSEWAHWGNYYEGEKTDWKGGFGQKVLGVNWHTHHGYHKHQSQRGIFAKNASDHPVLKGIEDGKIWGATDVYGLPLPINTDIQPIVMGQVVDRAGDYDEKDLFYGMKASDTAIATRNPHEKREYHPNDPMMPIVWTKNYQLENGKTGVALTSTIGASSDLVNEELRRLMINGVYFLLNMDVPERANVDLVGKYEPTQFQFHDDDYWNERDLQLEDYN